MKTVPERLGPYTIRRAIGRGGMGVVYECMDNATGQVAAVKLLAAEMAGRTDFRERFEAEIESLRKLNHPNIVRMFGFGHEDDHLYYAMEFVAGSSMEDQLARGRVFDWREVTQIGIDLARALRHAHDRGVIHRDIKPGNLLMRNSGEVKLSDFGIARLFGNHRVTSVGSVLGTAEFMSPEQAGGKPVDPRSDLYSLGAVMYVMLARRPLFNATTFIEMLDKQRHETPAPLHRLAPDVPPGLEQIIHRLLEKDPDRRYATATALARRLEDFAESQIVAPEEPEDESMGFVANLHSPRLPGELPAASIDQMAETRVEPHHEEVDLLTDSQSVLAMGAASPNQPLTARSGPTQAHPGGPNAKTPSAAMPLPSPISPVEKGPATESDAAPSPPEQLGGRKGRFVTVTPGDLEHHAHRPMHGGPIALQVGVLAVGLIALGLAAWHFMRPLDADTLARRVETKTTGQSEESMLAAEDEISQFVARFPDDPRSEHFRDIQRQIDMLRLERRFDLAAKGIGPKTTLLPIERTYLDALLASRADPEVGAARFQAIIDLFGSQPGNSGFDKNDPAGPCIELARRRLAQLTEQNHLQQAEVTIAIAKRLNQADALGHSDAARADRIYRAVIELYGDRRWAEALVRRAKDSLANHQPLGKSP